MRQDHLRLRGGKQHPPHRPMGRVTPKADGLDPGALPDTKPEADTQSKS